MPDDAPALFRLLTACGLPTDDLRADALTHFLVVRDGARDGDGIIAAEARRGEGWRARMAAAAEQLARDSGAQAPRCRSSHRFVRPLLPS
jgi:hypothetical protein